MKKGLFIFCLFTMGFVYAGGEPEEVSAPNVLKINVRGNKGHTENIEIPLDLDDASDSIADYLYGAATFRSRTLTHQAIPNDTLVHLAIQFQQKSFEIVNLNPHSVDFQQLQMQVQQVIASLSFVQQKSDT